MALRIKKLKYVICPGCKVKVDTELAEPLTETDCHSCGLRLTIPAKFDKFLITEAIGRGARGAVYRAYDPTMEREVALKVTRGHDDSDREETLAKMTREARALAGINHPNVVSLYGFQPDHNPPYLEMQHLPGGSLSRAIHKTGRLAEGVAVRVALDVALAILAVSDNGLVHRDIKPGNILFNRDEAATLIDFGFATKIGEPPASGAIGSPGYIAPEVIHREPLDSRTDQYSLGCTMFYMMTGRRVYEDPTPYTGLQSHLEPAPPLGDFAEDVHPETCRVVDRMLLQPREWRYQTVDEVVQELNDLLYILESAGRFTSPTGSAP